MELSGKKIIILVEALYNEHELWYPYYRLKEAGAEVTLVGSGSATTYHGKEGMKVEVDEKADDIDSKNYDGLIIPGGYAPDHMRRYPAMVELVREMVQTNKTTGVICHGGWMLASANVAKDRTLTSFFAIRSDLVHAGAEWVDKEVVVDKNLVTSRSPADLPAFMRAIITSLKS